MGFLSNIYGSKPDVPELQRLDLGEEQRTAIQNNLAALPEAQQLVSQSNLFSASQIDDMLRRSTPNLDAIRGNVSTNIESMTRGEIPQDVQNAVQNSAAARALAGGYGGSVAHGNLVARDLGLTSLDLTTRGMSAADAWLRSSASLYQPSMLNLSSMFISPSQQAAFDINERDLQFQRDYLENQIDAMPDPVLRGVHDTIMEFAGMAAGAFGSKQTHESYKPSYGAVDAGGGWGTAFGSGYSEVPYGTSYNPYTDQNFNAG